MAEWRSQLISLDANNRLLYYRDLKVGTLDLADAEGTTLEQFRRDGKIRLGRLFPGDERLATALKSARQIAAKARVAEEEFGVPIAYLAIGMATWDDGRTPQVQRLENESIEESGGKAARRTTKPAAPILLQPVAFEALPGTRDGYSLQLEGESFVNPVLLHLMTSVFDVEIDEAAMLEAAGDDEMVFRSIEKSCSGVREFAIADRVLIGTFSYLKQPMVDDLDDDQVEFLAGNDMIAAIAGVAEARDAVRVSGGDVSETMPDTEPPVNEYLVLDADASQSYVINAASRGQHLVIQGPPGTGKSQSIANLIADLVAHGKTVLFVAQKRAAITAVLRRLDSVDLGHLALDMFEGGGSRKAVVTTIGEALDSMKEARSVSVDALHVRWTAARDKLTKHQAALHGLRLPWEVSLWGLMAMERGLSKSAASNLRLAKKDLDKWTATTVHEMAGVASELSAAGGFDEELVGRIGWGIDAFSTLDELQAAHEICSAVDAEHLPALVKSLEAWERSVNGTSQLTTTGVGTIDWLLSETVQLWSVSEGALDQGVSAKALKVAIKASATKEWRAEHSEQVTWAERRAGRHTAKELLGKLPDKQARHSLLLKVKHLRESWEKLGAATIPDKDHAAVLLAHEQAQALCAELRLIQVRIEGVDTLSSGTMELGHFITALLEDPYRLSLPLIHELREKLGVAGFAGVLAEMSEQHLDYDTSDQRVRYVFAMSLAERFVGIDKRLAGVTRQQLERWAAEFLSADDEHLKSNAARVRRIAAETMKDRLNFHANQRDEIKRQLKRKRGFSSVRKLFHDAPEALLGIKPCWAMSPLMVSQMLPAAQLFDVVIFDEASQVVPADAIPAIARGRQLVVAGDQHQLPPTDIFQKLSVPTTTNDADDVDDDDTDGEVGAAVPETRDVESILDALSIVLEGRSRTLTWHYRSKDEKLIATNNSYVYSNQLVTFPGADGAERIHFEVVPPSKGLGRNNKSPSGEVNRVVDLALEHARAHPEESLGVIAFGSDHANRIDAALDARLRDEPELQPFFQQAGREPFFVKNIERVQGDEREAIILTVGYGKGDDGKLRYMWGPLLNAGGERRLNVATSRARSRMTLVASFGADDIDPSARSSKGFELMYRFFQFMSSGGTSFGDDPGRNVEMNPFEIDVKDHLEARGLQLEPQWGVGKYFIDFAVKDPEHPGRFVLAVECDGAMYHSGLVARERDRLRQQHLERLGWQFHRIWSTDWWRDPEPQVEETVGAYEAALAAARRISDEPTDTLKDSTTKSSSARSIAPSDEVRDQAPHRTLVRPHFQPGLSISEYRPEFLVGLVKWIISDGVVRTRDEILEIVMAELGFARRGSKIVDTLEKAIVVAERPARK
jgi:very-short-patch-repair endonuclease/DNA polymerase III delta prime subunit